jgi:ATP diphosphatase
MGLDRLDNIMKRLRDRETGCEWDSVQTFEAIAPDRKLMRSPMQSTAATWTLVDELGDLQLQVVFHARMAESGHFTLQDVLARISDKRTASSPHIRRCGTRRTSSMG